MKRLYYFSIRSFAGPFLVTFAISMFILVMQFLWKYVDDLMGKGLGFDVIAELMFYVSAHLIPLALPLAILLSSVMTFGNLSENNELTALKSSGLSLYRILRPLSVVILIIAMATFYFANYVIPVANLKWHSLIFDIQNTKISKLITPGVYNHDMDGYVIKVDEGNEDQFKGIIIHDHTDPNQLSTIRAEEGHIYKSENGKFLYFELKNGHMQEELEPQTPRFTKTGEPQIGNKTHVSRKSSFKQATYKINLTGFDLSRSQEDLFVDQYEMLNVFQLNTLVDSIQESGKSILQNFVLNIESSHAYFQAYSYEENTLRKSKSPLSKRESGDYEVENIEVPTGLIQFDDLTKQQQIAAITRAQGAIRAKKRNIQGQADFMKSMETSMNLYLIESHRKFALTVAIIILFFVGAPLGAIVRKGGFGAPVVIAALLFMVYFVLITIGDNLAHKGTVSPFVGMWFSSLVLLPIAIWLLRSAANDTPITSRDYWTKLIRLKRK